MNHRRILFEFDSPTVGHLALEYEFTISRYKDSDDTGRKWWVPRYTHGLVEARLTTPKDKEHDWSFKEGGDMDAKIKAAMRELDADIWEAIENRIKEIVNNANYEDNPHASDPPDDR